MNKDIREIRKFLANYLNDEKKRYKERSKSMPAMYNEGYLAGLDDGFYIVYVLLSEVLDGQQ